MALSIAAYKAKKMTPYDTIENLKTETSDRRPSREEAEAAVEVLLRWAGDDPTREGLLDTPARVVRSFEEFFAGYQDMVMLRDIYVQSHCEHHMVPITGKAHIAYMPDKRVVGISKLARVVNGFGYRLQTQETMTAQIANCIQTALQPNGVAVLIDASHQCMTTRGVKNPCVSMITTQFTGAFQEDSDLRNRFYQQAQLGS